NPRRDSTWAFFIPLYDHMLPAEASIDDAIRLYLKRYGTLVAIGAVGTAVGASRVRVGDDQWQSYFEMLARGATLIVMLCGFRDGTMWEMEQISRDDRLIEKTVFILMPAQEEWDLLLGWMRQRFRLPDNATRGEAFVFGRDGGLRLRATVVERES